MIEPKDITQKFYSNKRAVVAWSDMLLWVPADVKNICPFVQVKESRFVNLIVAGEGNKNEDKLKKFVQRCQTAEVVDAAAKVFEGGTINGC